MRSSVALLALTILLPSCARTGPAGDSFCSIAAPILIAPADALSVETARDVLRHNLTGRALCRW